MCWKLHRKRKGRNNSVGHYALTTSDRHETDASDPEEQKDDYWEFQKRNVDFYESVVVHCKDNPDVDIDAHEKDRVADRELDKEEL